ncbi:hypothetical protein B0H19DRAFT_1096285 [Mycena capillaripes]|nr:hypothetical protein B0H19DRAFT_1096285 [Mycena capillaripes]
MWLDRSGQCPLSISLRSAPEYDSPPASPSISARRKGQILQTLIAFAPRWQHVRFTAQSCLEDMAHLTVSDVPILESIAFHLLQRFPPTPVTFQPCEMLRSPRISSFSISGNNFIPEKLPLHWHQLTNLTIDGPVWETLLYSETALHTLSRCPNLRGCKLVINDGSPAQIPVVHPAVELQFLRTLELDFGNVLFTVARLLERLSVPELRTFTFHGHVDPQSPFSLAPFFGSWTRLECLNISSNTFVKPTLLDMLQNLPPTLRRLTILDITRTSEFMSLDDDSLAVLATSCPTLETLIIKYCFLISDASLLQFITARMTSESRPTLRRVEIQFNRHMTLDIFPSLEPFIKTGLNVSITHLPVPIFPSQFSPWQGLDEAVSAWVYP